MKLDVSKRARRDAERIDARWRKHGDEPALFANEFLAALTHLVSVVAPGTPCPTARRPSLKRFLMEKSKCHVYFVLDEAREVIRVVTVWNGQRERGPNV